MQTQVFDTKPLLRPAQAEEARSEIKALEAKLQSPHIEDKGEVSRQLRRVRQTAETQIPKPPVNGEEEGRMVTRSQELLSDIMTGMPSQEEMRKAPPGAVDKHMKWEFRNKLKIQEWKNIQLRLKPGEAEAANLERHRPTGSSLNMDNAYIPGKLFFMPPNGAGLPVIFSDEQLAVLRSLDPLMADRIAFMSNTQRAEIKDIVVNESLGLSAVDQKRADGGAAVTKKQKANKKRPYTDPAKRQAAVERMAKARAAKVSKSEAVETPTEAESTG